MTVLVVELRRNPDGVTGTIVSSERFTSWIVAWRYYQDDLSRHKECPCTKIIKMGKGNGIIQHWGVWKTDAPECCCDDLKGGKP